ncbi:MAG: N-acetylneuraminate synthase [bacterium]
MHRLFSIADREIGHGRPVFIVAEGGVNHNGRVELALELVDAAARAGADAIKFQTFRAEELASTDLPQAEYQKRSGVKSQREMLKELELPTEAYPLLAEACREKGIIFFSTPFDGDSLDLLIGLDVPAIKVPSGEVTNHPFLKQIALSNKPVLLSTGMADLEEVWSAVAVIRRNGDPPLAILHCTTSYPASSESINLRAMQTLEAKFHVPVGLSDHSEGIDIPLAAVAQGAVIIEKHFTLSRDLPGPDHRCSLEPDDMARMVAGIRKIELALGTGEKKPHSSEEEVKRLVRRHLAFKRDLRAGNVVGMDDLVATRCGGEVYPSQIESVVGRKLLQDQKAGTPVHLHALEERKHPRNRSAEPHRSNDPNDSLPERLVRFGTSG